MAVGWALAGWCVMGKHLFRVNEIDYAVDTATAPDSIVVTVNGEMFGVTLNSTGTGEGVLYSGHQTLPYFVCKKENQLYIWLAGTTYVLETVHQQPQRGSSSGSAAAIGNEVKAPMPGTVLKINAKAGETVPANTPLVIMESMKMEMTLAVPVAVKILEIFCTEGQLVDVGAVLVKINVVKE